MSGSPRIGQSNTDELLSFNTHPHADEHTPRRGFRKMHSLPEPRTPSSPEMSVSTSSATRRNSLRSVPSFTTSKKSRTSSNRLMLAPSPPAAHHQQSYHEYYDEYIDKDVQTPVASRRSRNSSPSVQDLTSTRPTSTPQTQKERVLQQQYSPSPLSRPQPKSPSSSSSSSSKPPLPILEPRVLSDQIIRRITSSDTDDYSIHVTPTNNTHEEYWKDEAMFQHVHSGGSMRSTQPPLPTSEFSTDQDEFPHLLAKALEKEVEKSLHSRNVSSSSDSDSVEDRGTAVRKERRHETGVALSDTLEDTNTISKNLMSASNMIYISGSDEDSDSSVTDTIWSESGHSASMDTVDSSPDESPRRTGMPSRGRSRQPTVLELTNSLNLAAGGSCSSSSSASSSAETSPRHEVVNSAERSREVLFGSLDSMDDIISGIIVSGSILESASSPPPSASTNPFGREDATIERDPAVYEPVSSSTTVVADQGTLPHAIVDDHTSAAVLRFRPPALRLNNPQGKALTPSLSIPFSTSPDSNSPIDSMFSKESHDTEDEDQVTPLPHVPWGIPQNTSPSKLDSNTASESHYSNNHTGTMNNTGDSNRNIDKSSTRNGDSGSIPLATQIHTKPRQLPPHHRQNSYSSTKSGSVSSNISDTDAVDVRSLSRTSSTSSTSKSPPHRHNNNSARTSPPRNNHSNSRSPPRSRIDTTQMPRPRPTKSSVHNPYVYHTKLYPTAPTTPKSNPHPPVNTSSHYLYHDSSVAPSMPPASSSPTNTEKNIASPILRKCPPMSTAEYICVDTGNATPRYVRMSTYAPPSNKALHSATSLPFVAHVTPFALPENEEMDIPLVDFEDVSGGGEEGCDPLRCIHCGCFINPHVSWILGGEKWQCNLCCSHNVTPSWYFSPLRASGRRADEESGQRPELSFGSVDFKVSNAYCRSGEASQVPTFIFVLDVSAAATSSGLLGAELKAVKNTVDSIYEWLQAESGASVNNDDEANVSAADINGGGSGSSASGGRREDDTLHTEYEDGMLGSGIDDRSGASMHANVSSAQAIYGTASVPRTSPPPPASNCSFTDTNDLFQMPSAASSTPSPLPDSPSYGPIRVGIVTFDTHVHFYSVKTDAADPVRVFMVDANDPFPPIPTDEWVLPLYLNKDKIDLILSSIPAITKAAPVPSRNAAGVREGGETGGAARTRPTPPQETRSRRDTSNKSTAESCLYDDALPIPPPPIIASCASGSSSGSSSSTNIYRMPSNPIQPVHISSKTTILPGKPGLLSSPHTHPPSGVSTSTSSGPNSVPISISTAPVAPPLTSLCPVAAVEAVRMGLSPLGGGRIILMTSSNASKGVGRTTRSPQPADYGTEKEFPYYAALSAANENFPPTRTNSPSKKASVVGVDGSIYVPPQSKRPTELDAYLELKEGLMQGNICLEVFFFVPSLHANTVTPSQSPIKIQSAGPKVATGSLARTANSAVFAELTRSTGGNLHLFSGSLLLEDNLIRFSSELLESIQSIAASEVTMKLQCSNGIRVTEYFGAGNFLPAGSEVHLGGLDRQSSSCFVLNFESEGVLDMGGLGTTVAEAASELGIFENISNLFKGLSPTREKSVDSVDGGNSPVHNMSLCSNARAVRSSSNRRKGVYHDGDPLYLQLSVTYTAQPSGERIVRVHNIELFTATDPSIIFRYADCHCLATFLCKQAAHKALHVPLTMDATQDSTKPKLGQDIKSASAKSSPNISHNNSSSSLIALSTGSTTTTSKLNIFGGGSSQVAHYSPRLFLIDTCLELLIKYRHLCSSHSPKGQLILPESLKVLPLYILGMLKHPFLLKNGHTNSQSRTKLAVDSCERAYELTKMLTQPMRDTIFTLYPRLYPLHNLLPDEGYPLFEEDEFDDLAPVLIPRWLKCSAEVIDSEGIYLLDDGTLMWLYIGRCVKQSVIKDLMGLAAGTQNPPSTNAKPQQFNLLRPSGSNNSLSHNISATSMPVNTRSLERTNSGRTLEGNVGTKPPVRSSSSGMMLPPDSPEGGTEKKLNLTSPPPPRSSSQGPFLRSLSSGGDRPRRRSSRSSTELEVLEDRDPSHSTSPAFVGMKPLLNIESEYAHRVTRIIDTVRESHTHKPELKIVWGGEVNANSSDVLRFGLRMIEDSIYGCQSYSDHLCELHAKIQSML